MLVLKHLPPTPTASVVQPPHNTQYIAVLRPRLDLLPSELRLVQSSEDPAFEHRSAMDPFNTILRAVRQYINHPAPSIRGSSVRM
eukprot:scaffold15972_cov73-Cyclotella_meneghiniana.AAC.9